MKTEFTILPNGLTLAVSRNMALNSVVVMAGVKVGSRHEPKGLHGAAHFAEHVFFKGTEKRPSSKLISTEIDSKGGDHNAFTDKEMTAFHVRMAKPDALVAVDVVHDMLAGALFRPSDIERERPVIREEISMYDNDPDSNAWEMSERHAFAGTGLEHRVSGNVEDVGFTPGALKRFLRHHYVPSRTIVVLSGAVDAAVIASAKKKFGSIPVRDFEGHEDPNHPSKLQAGHDFKPGNTDRLHIVMRFPGVPLKHPDARPLELLGMILGGYMSARLFQSLREGKGLCYSVGSALFGYSDVGNVFVSTSLDRPKFGAAMKAILTEVATLRKAGVTKDELAKAKTHRRGTQLIEMEQPMSVAGYIVRQMFTEGRYEDPKRTLDKLMAVSQGDVHEAIREYLDPAKAHIAVVGPKAARKEVLATLGALG